MNEVLERYYRDERENLLRRLNFGAGTPENAEDVLQEAFVRALTYWDTFDPKNKELGAWFSTILKNSLRDFKRAEWLFGMGEEFDEELYDPQEMEIPEDELIRQIYELVDGKEDGQREVLLLYFEKHYKFKDIQNITGYKYNTIHSIVRRFKVEVKDKYA
ncbi:RNA polymerase sigma factor [compost metagenome]